MAFVSGLMGPYMSPIPINACIGMLISLAIAFVVTPWLALKLIKQEAHVTHDGDTKLLTLFRARLTPFLTRRSRQGCAPQAVARHRAGDPRVGCLADGASW